MKRIKFHAIDAVLKASIGLLKFVSKHRLPFERRLAYIVIRLREIHAYWETAFHMEFWRRRLMEIRDMKQRSELEDTAGDKVVEVDWCAVSVAVEKANPDPRNPS